MYKGQNLKTEDRPKARIVSTPNERKFFFLIVISETRTYMYYPGHSTVTIETEDRHSDKADQELELEAIAGG